MTKKKAILLTVFFLATLTLATTFAKYRGEIHNFYLQKSKNFYFTSDLLTVNNKEYILNNWDGIFAYTISLNVQNMLNKDVWTSQDIRYEVSLECPEKLTCTLETATQDILVYDANHTSTNEIRLKVLPKVELTPSEEVDVVVKAKAIAPYRQTLSATFKMNASIQGIGYKIQDSENEMYATLILTNRSVSSKNVHLTFDNSLVKIDTANDIVQSAIASNQYTMQNNYINSIDLNITGNDEIKIYFYKNDISQNYSTAIGNNNELVMISETH